MGEHCIKIYDVLLVNMHHAIFDNTVCMLDGINMLDTTQRCSGIFGSVDEKQKFVFGFSSFFYFKRQVIPRYSQRILMSCPNRFPNRSDSVSLWIRTVERAMKACLYIFAYVSAQGFCSP